VSCPLANSLGLISISICSPPKVIIRYLFLKNLIELLRDLASPDPMVALSVVPLIEMRVSEPVSAPGPGAPFLHHSSGGYRSLPLELNSLNRMLHQFHHRVTAHRVPFGEV
jgi:hypothetical protein